MSKLQLKNSISQRLSPQQMQTIKLLHLSEEEMPERIEQEIEDNPALEKDDDSTEVENEDFSQSDSSEQPLLELDSFNYKSTFQLRGEQDWYNNARDNTPKKVSLYDRLLEQLSFLDLAEREHEIALYIIASLENDGYLRRGIKLLVNDLAFSEYIYTSEQEVEKILKQIQQFDPPGVGTRDLQECLIIQINRLNIPSHIIEITTFILEKNFDLFIKNKISKIESLIPKVNKEDFLYALKIIGSLNTKPYTGTIDDYKSKDLYPDFIVNQQNGKLYISLFSNRLPPLHINKTYTYLLERYKKSKNKNGSLKEAAAFAKHNIERAKWFITAIEQRRSTLLAIMNAIVELQQKFFLTGEVSNIKPLTMKEVSLAIKMDTSTVSRVVSNKHVKTDNGIYPLKYFFNTGISTIDGNEVSNKEVKLVIKEIIALESKSKPYSDEKISELLKERGYNLARRTVAKYRENLNIPTSRDRI